MLPGIGGRGEPMAGEPPIGLAGRGAMPPMPDGAPIGRGAGCGIGGAGLTGAAAIGFGAGAAGFGFAAAGLRLAAADLAAGLRAGALRAADFAARFRAGFRADFRAVDRRAVERRADLRAPRAALRAVLRPARAVLRAVLRPARAVLRAVFRADLRAFRAVLRTVLRAFRAVLRAVPRRADARRAGLLRAVFLVVRFFPVVLVAMSLLRFCFDDASTRSTRRVHRITLHLVQACRPTWRVNYFFSLYADCSRKWQFDGRSSPDFNNQFFPIAPSCAGICTPLPEK